MGSKRKEAPLKAETITLIPNGRLTEHTAHLDIRGVQVPEMKYRNGSGKLITFIPMKLVIHYQWSWTASSWHMLEVKALGRNGVQDVTVKFTNPETAPEWVRRAVEEAAPALTIPTGS